jgi:hypothetical protein
MIKLKIKVTKDILKKSMYCSESALLPSTTNCAVALAVRDIFPDAKVFPHCISPFSVNSFIIPNARQFLRLQRIQLPKEAAEFIETFDSLMDTPEERLKLPELEFEVEIPDAVIEHINIEELKPLLEGHPTLELV